ncbi:MAG: hypothetical protein R3F35_11630 [Myxococcota bacterium]
MTLKFHLATWLIGSAAVCLVPTPQGWKSCEQVNEEERSRDAVDCSLISPPDYSLSQDAAGLLELMIERRFEQQSDHFNRAMDQRASNLQGIDLPSPAGD